MERLSRRTASPFLLGFSVYGLKFQELYHDTDYVGLVSEKIVKSSIIIAGKAEKTANYYKGYKI